MPISEEDIAQASELHEQARSMDDDAALEAYARVLAIDPNRASTHYNMGLIHKYRGAWSASKESNQLAVALTPTDEAVNWNLGIAATALGDWATARETWARLGIQIEPGEGPINADFGITPVRLNPDDDGEVVWGRRIDPARVRIENIPLPKSGFRYGDVVLHDGAPVGYRESGGREYAVFNVLQRHAQSEFSTHELELRIDDGTDPQEIGDALDAAGFVAENWTLNVRRLCRACSEGRPHENHDHEGTEAKTDRVVFGVAAEDASDLPARLARVLPKKAKLIQLELKLKGHRLS